jgi:uncharacterized protein (TIGR03437 family)
MNYDQALLIGIIISALCLGWPQPLPPPVVARQQVAPAQVRHRELKIDFSAPAQAALAQDVQVSQRGLTLAAGREKGTFISSAIPVPLEAPEPFLAVAAVWSATTGDESLILISARASSDGNNWSQWEEFIIDDDSITPSGEYTSGLILFERETNYIQYRVELARGSSHTSPTLTSLRFSLISPGSTPEKQPGSEVKEAASAAGEAFFPKPAVITRTEWGCPDGQSNPRATPQYTTVTHLIVHHTAGSNTASDWAAVVRSIWSLHVFTNGWSDIGYNYLIDPNGMIYEGRAGGDNVIGAHFSCANSGTLGVALLGTFTSVSPTSRAITSLQHLLAWKSDQRGLDPAGITFHMPTQLNLNNISGHRDANASTAANACPSGTVCPGDVLYAQLPATRAEVKSLVSPVDDFTLSATTPTQIASPGSTADFTINTATTRGSPQTINLSVRQLPSGVSASFIPPAVTTGQSATAQFNISPVAAPGNYPLTVIGSGSTLRASELNLIIAGAVANVSAASYSATALAPEAIVAAFGSGLATTTEAATGLPLPTSLAGTRVKIKDSTGVERVAPLFFVSPAQINYQMPPGTATGQVTVTVRSGNDSVAMGSAQVAAIAPALFTANANGQGVAAAVVLRIKADGSSQFEAVAQFDPAQKKFVARPIDLSSTSDEVFLILYGTGIRSRSSLASVMARVGGAAVEVLYAGAQGDFVGLDQINLRLPSALSGRGEVDVRVTVDGKEANFVRISIR